MSGAAGAGPFTAAEIARRLGGAVEGDGDLRLSGVRGLAEAGPEHLSFLSNRKYARQLKTTRAGAVLLDRATGAHGRTAIRCADPYLAFAQALDLFYPLRWPEPGVDPQAWIAPDAQVDGAAVEAFAWVGPGARVGVGSWLEAGAYVGAGATVGRDCRLMAGSVVCAGCSLGDRVWLNPGAVIGGQGFGFAPTAAGHVRIPQTGRAVIEDDVDVGANTCVDRATMGDTVVRRGAKLDDLVMIGHGVEIGEDALLAGQAAVAGSSRLGSRVIVAGRAGAINHVTIADGVQIAAGGIAMSDQPAGARLAGVPAIDHKTWLRASVAFEELPALLRRVRKLEKRLAELEGREAAGD